VLVAEDLHWFDTASHDLLAALAAELATRGWLVVATTRPGGPAWAAGVRRLELGPLDGAALRAVALHRAGDRPLDDATLAEAVRRSAGNPLYLAQLVDAALGAEGMGLPESAERIVGARIDRLAPDDRRRLRAASVLGADADLALLAAVTHDRTMTDPLVWAPLGEFARVDDGVLRFGHDLFRLAAYEGLPHAERVRLHGRVAAELELRGDAPAAELAAHHRHARQVATAARWGRRAAEQAEEATAWGDAARLWQEAADCAAAARLAAEERCDLLVRLGAAREVLAQPEAAESAYRAALRLAGPERRCAIRSRLAWVAFRTDHFASAKRRITAATADLDTANTASRGALATQLQLLRAAVASAEGAVAVADRTAREALRTATALGRRDLRAEALLQLAIDADLAGRDDAPSLAADALALLTAEGMHYEQGLLHGNLGVTLMEHGDWIGALSRFEAADEGFARSGNLFGRTLNDLNRAAICLEQGHLVEAADLLEDSRRRARIADTERIVHFAAGSLGRARAWQGDPDRGVRELRPAVEALDGLGQAHLADTLRSYLAEVLLLGGRLEEAAAEAGALGPSLRHHSAGQVVELTVERIRVLADALADTPRRDGSPTDPARRAVEDLLGRARSAGAAIEVARCLQALDLLDGATDPLRLMERQAVCDSLGVVWMPPVVFAPTADTPPRVAGTAPG
jgi:tetratricopeptide (TPR) repeat protein